METQNAIKWLKTSGLAAVGGGIAGAFAAAMDPTKYHFPHDIGSGKLWKFFFMGAGLTFGSLLLRSPLGQQAMSAYRDSQQQAAEDKAAIEKLKGELRQGGSDDAGKAGTQTKTGSKEKGPG